MHVSLVPAAAAAASQRNDAKEPGQQQESGAAETGGNSSCKLLTLARDGVYLPVPRLQGGGDGRVVLAPGSRADLAVRCDRPGVYRLVSSKGGAAGGTRGAGEDGDEVPSIMEYLGQKTDVFEGESGEEVG